MTLSGGIEVVVATTEANLVRGCGGSMLACLSLCGTLDVLPERRDETCDTRHNVRAQGGAKFEVCML